MIKLYRNGNELTNFILSTPYKDTLDAELDKLNFQIKSTTRLTFKKNDKIRYWNYVSKNNTNYTLIDKKLCLFDWLETLEGEYWLYQLTCFSPTKLLEGIIINGMANTGLGYTTLNTNMTQVVDKINAQMQIEWYNNTGYFNKFVQITYEEANGQPLRQFSASDFLWSGQMTAREILNEIADKGDSIVVATDFEFSDDYLTSITITTRKKEGSGSEILSSNSDIDGGGLDAIEEVVKGLSIHRDSELNNNLIVSLIKNGITKDNIQSMYLPARNDDLTIDDAADWHILTDAPIYSINNVKVLVPSKTSQSYYVSSVVNNTPSTSEITLNYYYGREEDITNYIVEKDVYDALPVSIQKKRLWFKRGEKGIYGAFKTFKATPLWSNTALYNIMQDLRTIGSYPKTIISTGYTMVDYPILRFDGSTKEWTDNLIYTIKSGSYWRVNDFYSLNLVDDNAVDTEYLKYSLFAINYQPYADSVAITEKDSTIERLTNTKNLAMLKNQNDRTIDTEKYYASQQSLVDRSGNDEMTIDVMYNKDNLASYYASPSTYKDSFWGLGDYFTLNSKKWSLIAREIEEYSEEYIKARLTFSKQFNARNSAINENKDKRLYGIPLNNYVDRYIIYRIKMGVNFNKKILIKCWDDFTGDTTTQGYCLKDGVALGKPPYKDIVFYTKDNYAVDVSKTKYSSTNVNVNLRYCYADGTLPEMDIIVDTAQGIEQRMKASGNLGYSRLPFMNTSGGGEYGYTTTFRINKDKMERIILVFKNMGVN